MKKSFKSINDIANYWKDQLEVNSTAVTDYYREIYEDGKFIGSAITYSTFNQKICNNLGLYSNKNMGISKLVLVDQTVINGVHICLAVFWKGEFWVIHPGQDNCEFNLCFFPKTYSPSQLVNMVGFIVKKFFNLFKEYGTGIRVIFGEENEEGRWTFDYKLSEDGPSPAKDLQLIVNKIEASKAIKRA